MNTAAGIKIKTSALIAPALLLLPGTALAHHFMDNALPQTYMQGLLSGLGHPLIGVDHAAFIVAAGFFLALVKGGMWGIVALIGGSLIGAALHLMGYGLPGGEIAVALSVILIGGLVMARRGISLAWLAGGFVIAGALHGHAYAEAIFGAEAEPLMAYLTGFSLIQFGVATGAFLMHRQLIAKHAAWTRPLSAGLGAVVGATGMVLLFINMAA